MTKKKLLALVIIVGVGQIVAFLFKLWIDFPNGYVIMLISSLITFIFAYKEKPVEKN